MSSQNEESRSAEDRASELELNKETLQDLDVEPTDASDVKGGGMSVPASTGRGAIDVGNGIMAPNLRTTRPTGLG